MRSTTERLVMGSERNVQQLRGQALLAHSHTDAATRRRVMSTALHGRHVGHVDSETWVPNEALTACEQKQVKGSGGLVTDTLLMTNRHVLGYLGPNSTECGAIEVSFEATVTDDGIIEGEFLRYHWEHPYVNVDHANAITKSPWLEENPWLANRLFQLGLDVWAENSFRGRSRRQRLHHLWPFRAMFASEHNGQNPDFRAHDVGFAAACEHIDIAPIGAEAAFSSDPEDEGYTPSGPFTNNIPAMFFGRTELVSLDEYTHHPIPNGAVELYVTGVTRWPGEDNTLSPLVSGPGFPDVGHENCQVPNSTCNSDADCNGMNVCNGAGRCQTVLPFCSSASTNANVVAHALTDCLYTSIDARAGFSGSPLLANSRYQTGDGVVSSEVFFSPGPVSFVRDDRGTSSADQGTWGVDSGGTLALCEVTEPNPVLDDCYMAVSQVTPTLAEYGGWDFDAGLGAVVAPNTLEPRSAPGEPYCFSTEGEKDPICAYFDHNGTVLEAKVVLPPPGHGLNPAEPQDPNFLGVPTAAPCTMAGLSGKGYGLAVGFVGGATLHQTTQQPIAVGSLKVVCAPWYAGSYHEQWRFLTYHGRRVAAGVDNLLAGYGLSGGQLFEYLRFASEERWGTDEAPRVPNESYLRPASMKLCPPNHYLQGFTGYLNQQNRQVEGIRTLKCLPYDAELTTLALEVPLGASSKYDGFTFTTADTPTLESAPFGLSQYLGNPAGVASGPVSWDCPPQNGKPAAISGIIFDDTSTGALTGLGIKCTELP